MKLISAIIFVFGVIFLTGCVQRVGYNPSYFNHGYVGEATDGQVQVVMPSADEMYVYSGSPSSFTGGGAKVEIPIGIIIREASTNIFEKAFAGGVVFANESDFSGKYRVVIKPKFSYLDFKFNQLQNLGFAITVQADVRLRVYVLDKEQNVILDREYSNGLVEGETYVASFSPFEKVNALIHSEIQVLLKSAAEDIVEKLK